MDAIGDYVIDRIRTLWGYRKWYRTHNGWIVQEKVDNERELRYLIALVRSARRAAAAEQQDAVTVAKAHAWVQRDGDHMAYPEDFNIEGMPEFNGAFR
jgi:hypothetical protein